MWVYVISTIIVIIASLCYFKKDAWENRYQILLMIGGVALIATLITNYIIRGDLDTYIVENTVYKEVYPHNLHDSLVCDTSDFHFIVDDYNFYMYNDKRFRKEDSLHQTKRFAVFYSYDGENYVIFFRKEKKRITFKLENIYIQPSTSDTTAYLKRRIKRYKSNVYTAGFSIPDKEDITVLYIPLSEYNTIPDSLLRKLPF